MSVDSVLAANLSALTARQPQFVLESPNDRIQLAGTTWRVVDHGRAVAFHSRDPQREADGQIATLFAGDRAPSLVVTIGLGAGYLLDALDRKGWTGTVIALEPEPATAAPLLERRDLRSWIDAGRLRILLAPDYAGASECQSLFGDGATAPPVYVNQALAQIRPAEVEQARMLVKRLCLEARANADARRTLGGRYLLNTLRNATAIAREGDAASLFDAARNVPAVVVAAGPSLDRALPILREVQGAALIICVDTALRPLLAADVRPDLVVAVDPSEFNAQHLTGLPPCAGTYLAAEGSLDPLAVAAFRGRTFFFNVSDHQPWRWLQQHGRQVGRLRAWGSVLTTTFDLTTRMGCNPIVFAGADLAYTGDRPYCRGVVFEETWRRREVWGQALDDQWARAIESQSPVEAPDVNGRPVRTAAHLLAFRNWLLEQIRRDRGRRFINATGGGILHGDGVEQSPLDRLPALLGRGATSCAGLVRDRYCPADAPSVAAALRDLLSSPPGARADIEATLAAWLAFAEGLTREQIMLAAHMALDSVAAAPARPAAAGAPTRQPDVVVDRDVLRQLASTTLLVPMVLSPERLLPSANGARVFRLRTNAARVATTVWRCMTGGVLEDGQSLARAFDIDRLEPGTYALRRDEVFVRASDGSDARVNGRCYTMLVPRFVSYLEHLPLDEVLRHDL